MLKRAIILLMPPAFPEDEDKSRKAVYAHWISLAFFGAVFFFEVVIRFTRPSQALETADYILIGIGVVSAACWWLLRRGSVSFTSLLLVISVWTATNGIAASGYGIRDTSFIVNFATMLMAALLLGWQASLMIGIMSAGAGFGLAYAETNGLIRPVAYPVGFFAVDLSVVFGLTIVLVILLVTGLENAIKRSRSSLKELAGANAELNRAQGELQAQAAQLVETNKALQFRTERLRAIAEVARTTTSVQDFDRLLPSITHVVSQQMGFYHVGIFLVDEQREYAILRAANTEGGVRMLARGHRLKVGEQGIVGFVTQTGTARIALDVEQDAAYFNNPDLPATRSELALPLKAGTAILGALDLQSTEANAFTEDDVALLTILADQIAIAIQNALSLEQAQRALREAEFVSRQASGEVWKGYTESVQMRGYRYDGIKSEAVNEASGSVRENGSLLVPVQLRGQTIGRLRLKSPDPSRQWTEDEVAMIEATAERVALALDGARLLEDAQKRASREALLAEIAAKLSTSFRLDSILRDTVEELGQTLKGSTVSFQLVNPSAPTGAPDPARTKRTE